MLLITPILAFPPSPSRSRFGGARLGGKRKGVKDLIELNKFITKILKYYIAIRSLLPISI